MRLDEVKYPALTQTIMRPSDRAQIVVTQNDDGEYIAKGGPFKGFNGVNIGQTGSLTPDQQDAVERWMGGEGEEGEAGAGVEQQPLSPEEQMIAEGVQTADEFYPGWGGALLNTFTLLQNLDPTITARDFFGGKGSGSVLTRALNLQTRRRPVITELDAENMRIVDAVHTDYSDHARGAEVLYRLINGASIIDGLTDEQAAEGIRALSDLIYIKARDPKLPKDKRKRPKGYVGFEFAGQIFFRTGLDGNLRGLSFNFGEGSRMQKNVEAALNKLNKRREALVKKGMLDEGDGEFQRVGFDRVATAAGGNISAVVKELSEIGEVSLFKLIQDPTDEKSRADLKALVRRFHEDVSRAMDLEDAALDMYADEALSMAQGMGGGDLDLEAKFIAKMLKHRKEFMEFMDADDVVRVGEGDVGRGFKPDVLYLYNEKPSHIDEKYLKKMEDGRWAVGVSLKTYSGRHGRDTTLGGTHSLGTMSGQLVIPSKDFDSHTQEVIKQLGWSPKQVREMQGVAQQADNLNKFCRSIAGDGMNLKGLSGAQARGVVTDQVLTSMEAAGIKLPNGYTRKDIEKLCKDAGISGNKIIGQEHLSRLSVHLEKEMTLKRLENVPTNEEGHLDPNHPEVIYQLHAYGSAALDSQWGADVMNSTVMMAQSQVFHNNQDGKVRDVVAEAMAGNIPVTYTAGRIQIGPCAHLAMSNQKNRVSMEAKSSTREGCV